MTLTVLHLWELPVDVWSLIVDLYLSNNDLALLNMSGSRALWHKLTLPGVVKNLSFVTDFPTSSAPHHCLLSMPNLRALEIALSSTSPKTQQLLAPVAPTLESLSLWWSPAHYGRRWPSWNLSLLPLTLTTFKSNLPIYDNDFSLLPRTLTSLELVRQESVQGNGFQHLPPRLSHLRLSITSDHLNTLKDNLCFLPSTLTSLELPYLSHIDAPFLSLLPETLLRLNLSRVHQFSDKDITLLPRGLLHLNIKAGASLANQSLHGLPQKLSFLCLQPNETSSILTADAVKILPTTITSYWELPRSLQCEYTRRYLQKQLEGVEQDSHRLPRWVESNLTDELMHMLPPDLHTLDLTNNRVISEHGVLRVPIGLQRLRLPFIPDSPLRWPGSLVKYLPRGLKDLDLPFTDDLLDSHIMKLPTNLTRLRLCVEAKTSPISVRSFQFLPAQLKQLEVPLSFFGDIDINAALFKLPLCQQITFGTGPGSITLCRDSNNTFLRDTLKHRYLANKTTIWVFDEVLRPLLSILGLVLVSHLLFVRGHFAWIPFAILLTPTITSSLIFATKRFIDPDTSLFSWRPSTDIILPQIIIFVCYSFLYLVYAARRPWSPW